MAISWKIKQYKQLSIPTKQKIMFKHKSNHNTSHSSSVHNIYISTVVEQLNFDITKMKFTSSGKIEWWEKYMGWGGTGGSERKQNILWQIMVN